MEHYNRCILGNLILGLSVKHLSPANDCIRWEAKRKYLISNILIFLCVRVPITLWKASSDTHLIRGSLDRWSRIKLVFNCEASLKVRWEHALCITYYIPIQKMAGQMVCDYRAMRVSWHEIISSIKIADSNHFPLCMPFLF